MSSQADRAASSPAADRTRIKVVLNIGRVELELLRTLKELRSIEPLARFQVLPALDAVELPPQDGSVSEAVCWLGSCLW